MNGSSGDAVCWYYIFMLNSHFPRHEKAGVRLPLLFLIVLIAIITSWNLSAGPEALARQGANEPSDQQTHCLALEASSRDATAAFEKCIQGMAPGTTLMVAPKIYHFRRPLTVNRPVKIITAGLTEADGGCASAIDDRCATFMLEPLQDVAAARGRMPIEIKAANVTFSHIRVVGRGGRNPKYDSPICLSNSTRSLGGGIRVEARNFTIKKSVIRDATCYTAIEVKAGSDRFSAYNNVIGPNGVHSLAKMWADGLTVHDNSSAHIAKNLFYDNTDVQLILGGCQRCLIISNRFRHSGSFEGASFAELMLQSWPSTSGNFSQSISRGNDIDCTPQQRCGYGIMIGSNPWYMGRVSGGEVTKNRVRFAIIGLNVDELSGVMIIDGNIVKSSGGIFSSDCGKKKWPAVNVSPRSWIYLRGSIGYGSAESMETTRCLMNRFDG